MRNILLFLLSFAEPTCALAQPKLPRPAPRLNLLEPCRGKTTVVAFIVTTCPHCQAFARTVLEPLYETGGVCAVAIAFDAEGNIDRFAREQKIRFPLYKVDRGVVRTFLGLTGQDRVIGTPQVVLIDKAGVIQAQSAPEGSPLLLQPGVLGQIIQRMAAPERVK